MKKINKLYVFLIILTLLMSSTICLLCGCDKDNPTGGSESIEEDSGYFEYTLLDDDTYEIGAKSKEDLPKDLVIPAEYNHKPVSRTKVSGFEYCTHLESVTIGKNITKIDAGTFRDCTGLKEVIFEKDCQLKVIGYGAFGNCIRIENLILPEGLEAIRGSFRGCSGLKSISIPSSVTIVEMGSFYDCTGVIEVVDNFEYVDNWAVKFNGKNVFTPIIRDGTVGIAEHLFFFSYATNITIPKSVKAIGLNAFEFCEALSTITYGGTMAEWKEIVKAKDWCKDSRSFSVVCTDGTLTGLDAKQ